MILNLCTFLGHPVEIQMNFKFVVSTYILKNQFFSQVCFIFSVGIFHTLDMRFVVIVYIERIQSFRVSLELEIYHLVLLVTR